MSSQENNVDPSAEEKQHSDPLESELKRYMDDISKSKATIKEEIEKRKAVEQSLKAFKQEKIGIFNSMAEHVIYYHDEDMEIVWANKAAASSIGMTPDELLGRKCYELWQERDTICENCPVEKALKTGEPDEVEMTTPDGRSWLVRGYPVKDEKGEIVGAAEVTLDLTAIRQAERILEESEKRLRTIFDSASDAMFIHDLDGNFLEVNQTACHRLGYSKEEFLNMSVMHIDTSEYATLVTDRIEELRKTGPRFFETAHVTKQGEIIPIELSSRVIEYQAKPAVLSIARDISERKHTEAALRESEDLYRSIVENSHAGILIVDDRFHFTYVNDELCRILEYSREEIIGHDFREFLDDESRVLVADHYVRRQRGEVVTPRYEFNVVQKNGEKRRVEISSTVVTNSVGKPITVAQILDITVRKNIEQSLRQSEHKYKTLTENVNIGIYRNTVGPKGKFIEVNPAIVNMFGYESKEQFLSIDVADLYQVSGDRMRFNEKMLTYGYVKDEILLLKKKNGTPFFAAVSAVAIKDEKGNVEYFDGIIDDITDRIKAEQDLKSSYEKLKRVLNGTVNALASTSEKRDPYTAGHQQRVTKLAVEIAREIGLSSEQVDGIRVAGLVHDIGKIQVAAEILNKPVALNDIEMELVRTHCQAGYEILKTIEFPWDVAEIVLQHHERINGSGYPRGLTGEKMMKEAKILAVADVVEAMASHRPYRPAFSVDKVLEEIVSNRSVLYDEDVVDACLRLFGRGFAFK
jgi:PAS domain S-box-containing protein/putative nucleotidyltransferase with HDIG domain